MRHALSINHLSRIPRSYLRRPALRLGVISTLRNRFANLLSSTTPKSPFSSTATASPEMDEKTRPSEFSALRTAPGETPRIAVLGGGFGGLYTALKLSELEWKGANKPEITLIDVADRFLFKPLMYELITGEATYEQVAPLFRDLLASTDVRFVQQKVLDVALVDTEAATAGRLEFEDGHIDYDWLVVGVGAEANLDLAPGAKENALPFNTLEDVENLVAELDRLEADRQSTGGALSISVVGGGVGGAELAATIADRLSENPNGLSHNVTLFASGKDIMVGLAPEACAVAREVLEAKGVSIMCEQRVEEVEKTAGVENSKPYVLSVRSAGQEESQTTEADLVLWTAGLRPVGVPFITTDNSPVEIKETLQVSGRRHEFALGDVAGMGLPATAQVAMQQADYCAWNIYAEANGQSLLNFRYQHLGNMMALGPLSAATTLNLPGVGDLTLKGPVASGLRKLAYIYRMPTNQQRLKVGLDWLKDPTLWLPSEMPKDVNDFEKFNPIAGSPNLEKLFNENAREEVKGVLKGLFERVQAEAKRRS